MSIGRWMDKEDVVHIHNGILLSHKQRKNPTICSNMDGPGGYYAQWNKPSREREIPNDFTHLWSIRTKEKLKEQNSSKITEPKNGLTGTKGKGTGEDGWVGREKGGEEERGCIKISMHRGGEKGEGCTTQRRQVVILQHFAMLMDSDYNVVFRGDLV